MESPISWNDLAAETNCTAIEGELAAIETGSEFTFIKDHVLRPSTPSDIDCKNMRLFDKSEVNNDFEWTVIHKQC